ncbi:MAG: glycerol kinase GlpK [Tepidisphaeraceae bacterium]
MRLAIDQSTSATKAMLFDDAGKLLASSSREHRQIYPQPAWVEHDAAEIWANVLTTVREVTRGLAEDIASLSITNQRETIVVFDRATGEPLHNAMVWQCRRGDAICNELRTAGHEPAIRTKTGLRVDTYFSASKLKWLIRERPDIAAKLRDGSALIGTIDAYLVYRLTGGKVFASDHTNASRTLLYDVSKLRWDDELCSLFDVPMRALPEVRECVGEFGATHVGGALPRSVSIRGVMGDSQAALFAQRCFTAGTGKATFGTGTSVLINAGHEWKLPGDGVVAALAWVVGGKPTYALEGLINYSAATIAWLKDQLQLIDDVSKVESIARSVRDSAGVFLVPAFAGLSAPYWSNSARAAIVGMSAHTTRAHVVRAALESIALQIRDVLDLLQPSVGTPVQSLGVDGGPTRNALLMQMTADLTRAELQVADVPEASAWGATLAGIVGERGTFDLAMLTHDRPAAVTYRPLMSSPEADTLHMAWRAAVQRVL